MRGVMCMYYDRGGRGRVVYDKVQQPWFYYIEIKRKPQPPRTDGNLGDPSESTASGRVDKIGVLMTVALCTVKSMLIIHMRNNHCA